MKILLIEDELLIQKSLKRLLERRGADVSVTSSGKEAISEIFNTRFDRIICDLMLEDISGFDVLEESKSVFSADEIKSRFIIITAYSLTGSLLENANKYGCQIINKPFQNIDKIIDLFLSSEDS